MISFNPKYWFSDEDTRYEMRLDKKFGKGNSYDKELQRLNDEFPSNSEKETDTYKLRKNELEYNYDNIGKYEFEKNKIEILEKDETAKKLKLLSNDFDFGKITEIEFWKNQATINGKPFVAVKPNFDEYDGDNFYLDIEYNELFIEKLKRQGYNGDDNNEIVDQWLKWKMINSFDNIKDLINNNIPTDITRVDVGDGKKLYK